MSRVDYETLIALSRVGRDGPFVDDHRERMEMERAVQLKRAGRYDESISVYKGVILANPQCDMAYKQMAKVQIVAGKYEDAIRSTLMKIDLGIYFTKQCDERGYAAMRNIAFENICGYRFSSRVCIGGRDIQEGEIPNKCRQDPVSSDVSLLAYTEEDVYYYLGHCLVRLYPAAYSQYSIPEYLLKNFENAIAGRFSGSDARDSPYAPVFYISGFLLARDNISWTLTSNDVEELRRRYNRILNYLWLGSRSGRGESSSGTSFWKRLFG